MNDREEVLKSYIRMLVYTLEMLIVAWEKGRGISDALQTAKDVIKRHKQDDTLK